MAADNSGKINKYFVELVTALLVKYGVNEDNYEDKFKDQKFIKDIMSKIQKVYEEMRVDNTGKFDGIVNGKRVVLKISKRFFKKVHDIIPVYQKYGYQLLVRLKDKDSEPKKMTIGEFLDECTKIRASILFRYKGLTTTSPFKTHLTAGTIV